MAQEIGIREFLEQINARFSSVEARFSSVEARFSSVEARFSSVEARLNRLETVIDDLRKEVHANFRWTIGLVILMWGSILGALVALAR